MLSVSSSGFPWGSVTGGNSLTLLAGGGYAPSGELPATELFKVGGIRT